MKFTATNVAFASILHVLLTTPSAWARLHTSSHRKTSSTYHHQPVPRPHPTAGATETAAMSMPETRIVGGEPVSGPDVFPFFVSWEGSCGASLIHSDIVLTAAHCDDPRSTSVTVDAFQLDNASTAGAVSRTIVDRSTHPMYNKDTVANDFLLLKLNSPVSSVTPIELNSLSTVPQTGQALTVIGMGDTADGGPQATMLMQVEVNVISDQVCDAAYKKKYPDGIDEDVMMCAGVNGGGKDSCQGDSGGPIFTMKNGKVDKQVGVVSWGDDCASAEFPGVYAEVSSAIEWINSEICRLSSDKPASCSGGGPQPTPPPVASTPSPTPPPVTGTPSPTPSPTVDSSTPAPTPEDDTQGDAPTATPTAEPTATPTAFDDEGRNFGDCDDTDGTIFVDNVAGDRPCDWLRNNYSWYGYLCEFMDVVEVCPSTCDWCELFET